MHAADTDVLIVVLAWPVDPGTGAEVTTPVIFANRQWTTAAADTPAALPATAIMESSEFRESVYGQQPDGLQIFGGVAAGNPAPIRIQNPLLKEEDTYRRPLDDVAGYIWSGARAQAWGSDPAQGGSSKTLDVALSTLTALGHYIVESFTPSVGIAELSLAPKSLEQPSTPFEYRGYGNLAGSGITRADQAALRATTSFTFRLGVVFLLNTTPGPFQVFATPLVRLRQNTSTVTWEIRNAAGTWQAFSGVSIVTLDTYQFGILYTSSTAAARLYVVGPAIDPQFLEEITVTGGLYASAGAAATVWDASTEPAFYSGTEHLSIVESEDWMLANLVRGVALHPSSTMAFSFDEGLGVVAFDLTGNEDATVSGGWAVSQEGKASLSGFRPPAVIGCGFGLPPLHHTENTKLVPGYAGDRTALRCLTQDGVRMKPDVTGASAARTINPTRDTIRPVPYRGDFSGSQLEFAPGQNLIRSPTGTNPTTFLVSTDGAGILIDPVLGAAQADGAIKTSTDLTAVETPTISISDNVDSEYSATSHNIVRNVTTYVVPVVNVSASPTGVLQLHMARNVDDEDMSAVNHTCQKFGPRLTPTITFERTGSEIWHHGWMVPGDTSFRELVAQIARSSLSVDGGPLAVSWGATGGLEVTGMRLDADASDDVVVLEGMIKEITPLFVRGKPGRVKVRYRKNHLVLEVAEALNTPDALSRRLRTEWEERPSGSGTTTGIFDSSVLRHNDARIQADALDRLQDFELFEIKLEEPVPVSRIASALRPFRQVTITWDKDPLWTARTAWTVGRTWGHRGSTASLSLIVASEIT